MAIASWHNVLIEIFRQPMSLSQLIRLRRETERFYAEQGRRAGSLSVVEHGAMVMLPSEVRAEAEAQSRDFPSIGTAVVFEGGGFRAATTRALVTGIHLLTGAEFPRKTFEAVPEASRWMVKSVLQRPESEASSLVAAVEEARAALALT